jgi:hypothetical protein
MLGQVQISQLIPFLIPLIWVLLHSIFLLAASFLIPVQFFFSSLIYYHFNLHRGGLLGWLSVFLFLFTSHSLSYIYLISASCPGDVAPLVCTGSEAKQAA